MPRRPHLAAGLALAAVLLTGCGASVSGVPVPAPTAGPGADPVGWMGHFCDAALSFATPATTAPDFAAADDLAALQEAYSGYLGGVVTGVRQARSALADLGSSPVPGGDAAVARVRDATTRLGQDFTGAKATVDAADPASPDAFVASVGQVEATLRDVTVPDVLGEVATIPDLARSAARAQSCTRLAALAPR